MAKLLTTDISLACACGKLRGVALGVSRVSAARIVCYCDDCQAYAAFLARPGITDAWGGTDVLQIAPSRVRLTNGVQALACVRLSEKGMYRWHCAECKTPLANTLSPRVPFVSLFHSFIAQGDSDSDNARDEVLGPPIGHVQTKFARGKLPNEPESVLRVLTRCGGLLAKWWLTGAGSPSPFFDAATRAPAVEPRILTAAERAALRPPEA
ncbi:MAG TPA: DUF6151 family protein [Polyangiaceae bacterium]